MFKNRAIQMKMVKDTSAPTPTTDPIRVINAAGKIGIALICFKTSSEIVIHIVKTYVK